MMNKKMTATKIAGVVAGVMLANAALAADGPQYTYVEGGYSWVDYDDLNADGDAFNIGGSIAATDMIHLFAGYQDGEVEVGSFDIDVSTMQLGAGLNVELSPTTDLVATAAWVRADLDANAFGSDDEDGYALGVGVRAMITPQFELNGGVSYVDISDDDTSLNIGAVYSFNETFALTGGASFGDNVTSYGIGVRAYFQ
ncbi:MAG: outer membrane beta-barrel protein [Gammaproteobacteria bacterium]|nr:outer membrane beta-barrel protein [Gammaproteobacteria bacterium]